MLSLEVVTIHDAQLATATGRSKVLLEYIELIRSVGPGRAGRLTPNVGETTGAISRRLGSAAELAGIDLTVKKATDTVYFWEAKRRRGRPKKVTLGG